MGNNIGRLDGKENILYNYVLYQNKILNVRREKNDSVFT